MQTLPPLPGVSFTIDGRTFVTDDHGFVRIDIDRWSPDLKERIKIPDTALADGSRASFSRWFDWSNTLQDDVIAAFFVDFPIAYTFVDLQGNPVDPATIDSLTFKSSTGVSNTFKQGEHSGEHMLAGEPGRPDTSWTHQQEPLLHARERHGPRIGCGQPRPAAIFSSHRTELDGSGTLLLRRLHRTRCLLWLSNWLGGQAGRTGRHG